MRPTLLALCVASTIDVQRGVAVFVFASAAESP
jgi:hypothetical protein